MIEIELSNPNKKSQIDNGENNKANAFVTNFLFF